MNDDRSTSVFNADASIYGKKITSVPKPERNVGIDTAGTFYDNLIYEGENSQLDITKLQSFLQISQSRETMYQLLDTMAEDPTIAAVLETYAEDATETNDDGRIVWCTSNDINIAKYITYLLDTMNVDKNSYRWVYSLCKYGDLYLRLYRQSDIQPDLFDDEQKQKNKLNEQLTKILEPEEPQTLQEDVNVIMYAPDDRYVHYIQQVYNPAEMFELTQFGKSYAYIQAKTPVIKTQQETAYQNNYYKYQFRKNDVDIYDATSFVHACLEDNGSRVPEEVELFSKDSELNGEHTTLKYSVRRGQSLLYNSFKVWREMMLLENSLLLNRITKSSIVRIVGVEVGDMPKEEVGPKLRAIKQLIEQKTAINSAKSMSEYTNPGPMENNVYVPTKNGVGAITTNQIGGDVDVKGLADIDYFKSKLFGSLRTPKQYFGDTDDSTGFNGGTSLSIISSRYAKAVKRIQNTYIQALTDAINLMLLDKGLDSYVNKFELHMVPPTTQEEIDRRDNTASKVQITSDIMNLLDDIDDPGLRLKILSSLLNDVINDPEVLDLINTYADDMQNTPENVNNEEGPDDHDINIDLGPSRKPITPPSTSDNPQMDEPDVEEEAEEENNAEQILPTPDQLNMDFTDNTQEF